MKATSFNYKGFTFKPVGNILGGFFVRTQHADFRNKLEIKDYEYYDFYKVAKKHNASCDVFEVEGKLYIPCSCSIVGIYNNPKIKPVEEYERWYH